MRRNGMEQMRTNGKTAAAETVSPFYIPSKASAHLSRLRTLKQSDTFIVVDPFGNAQAEGPSAEGLYYEDTRFLSQLVLLVNGDWPLLLTSSVTAENDALTADLTNPDFYVDGTLKLARDSVHLLRAKVLTEGACFEALEVKNFARDEVTLELHYGFAADFRDMFEVRGQRRAKRGTYLPEEVGADRVVLGYRGLDDRVRRTEIGFAPRPERLTKEGAHFRLRLPPGGS